MWKHRFERNHISFMHLILKRGCTTVKATDELACSAQSGAQITVQAFCCSRKCLLRVDCLYFPITEKAYSISRWTMARDFGPGILPQCALWGRLVWIWNPEGWSWLCVAWEKIFPVSQAGWTNQYKQLISFSPHWSTCSFLHQKFFTVHSCLSAVQGKDDFVGFSASLAGEPWF